MSSVNKVFLLGRVGTEPELKYMASGDAVLNFTLATSDKWKDKTTGEMRELVEWHNVVVYRRLAEIIAKMVKKGSKVYIEGKNKTRKWQKNDVTHYKTEVEAVEILVLDKKTGEVAQSASSSDDDLPF